MAPTSWVLSLICSCKDFRPAQPRLAVIRPISSPLGIIAPGIANFHNTWATTTIMAISRQDRVCMALDKAINTLAVGFSLGCGCLTLGIL